MGRCERFGLRMREKEAARERERERERGEMVKEKGTHIYLELVAAKIERQKFVVSAKVRGRSDSTTTTTTPFKQFKQ